MTIKKIITSADIGTTPNPVYINKTTNIQSFYCGIISLITIIILVLYSINKLTTLQISYENHQTKDYPSVQLSNLQFIMKITIYDGLKIVQVDNENMYSVGLNITINTNKNGFPIWTQNLTNHINQKEEPYFSIPENFPKQIYFQQKYNFTVFQIHISKCESEHSPQCKQIDNSTTGLMMVSYTMIANTKNVIDGKIQTKQNQDFDLIQLADSKSYSQQSLVFNKFVHTQDLNILPSAVVSPNITESWCYFDVNDQYYQSKYSLKIFQFAPSEYTYRSISKIQKLDDVLPKIFTVFSLAALALTHLSRSYRSWALHLKIYNKIFKKKDQTILTQGQNQDSKVNINLKDYSKYMISNCKQSESAQQTTRKIKKVIRKIDLVEMAKQIHKLRKQIKIMCRRSKISEEQWQRLVDNEPESQGQVEEEVCSSVEDIQKRLSQG